MAERLVLDASAALAILRAEPEGGDIVRALQAEDAGTIVVPDHFWLEVTNVLIRRFGWDPGAVVEALHALDDLGIETAPIERPLVLLAIDLMAGHRLSAYDAAYLALAVIDDAPLVTLDAELGRASGGRARSRSRRRMSEARARYGSPAAGAPWAANGRYIAELRRKLVSA